MPRSPDTTTIYGQYQLGTTIPAAAKAAGLKKGDKLKWRVIGRGRIELQIEQVVLDTRTAEPTSPTEPPPRPVVETRPTPAELTPTNLNRHNP